MEFCIRSLQEFQQLRTTISSIFIGVILYDANKQQTLVIQESDKEQSRFPGGGVEAGDDFKHILADLRDKGLRNAGGLLNILKHAAKRELKEEISLGVDETQLTFVFGLLTKDQEGEGYHLKVFFRHPLPENFLPQLDPSRTEEESLTAFHLLKVAYDSATKFLQTNPSILLSRDHFRALLEGIRNGKL